MRAGKCAPGQREKRTAVVGAITFSSGGAVLMNNNNRLRV